MGMSVKRGVGVYLFLKEYCLRVSVNVSVRVRVDTNPNPNPKTAFFEKKR